MKNFIQFICLLIFSSLFACNPESEEITINQLLTNRSQKTWTLQSVTLDGDELLDDCEKDDEWTFKQGNTMTIKPGFLRCSLQENEVSLSWFLGSINERTLYLNFPPRITQSQTAVNFITKCNITEITQSVLKLDVVEEGEYGDRLYVFKYNFIRKDF